VRILYLNGLPHSGMYLGNSTQLVFQYSTYFNLGMQLDPGAKDVLFIGGGGFSGPKFFLAAYPHVHVDVAEIDPDVIDTAQSYFGLKPDPRLTIFSEDARVYLGETDKTYDLVILDAYAKTYVPFHLMTKEFFKLLSDHLAENGIVISNLIGSLEGDSSNLVRSYYSTLSTLFNDSALFEVDYPNSSSVQNIELVFRRPQGQPLASAIQQVDENITALFGEAAAVDIAPTGGYVQHMYSSRVRVDDVPLLTDNYAPVEALLNPITGEPYSLEQQFGRLVPTTQVPEGQSLLMIGEASILGVAWLFIASRKSELGPMESSA